ncbi:MAG: long-chain fatty acid--CoA ligase, partial [Myxococcales bacterium]|nr:long-chain fatty acid--CoA ligase [Myxococcales bacterium]
DFPGTVGKPLPTVEVEIRDESSQPLANGCEGEVYIRSPLVMAGYWNNPPETERRIDDAGWLASGDLGTLQDGRLYISSRRTDLIIRGGENIYPAEIEQVLEQHPAVEEAAVVAVPDEEYGHVPKAIVVICGAVSHAELESFVAERLAYFKVPRIWETRRSPLPRNASQKVERHRL